MSNNNTNTKDVLKVIPNSTKGVFLNANLPVPTRQFTAITIVTPKAPKEKDADC